MIRGPYQKKKHCKRGHERTPNNVSSSGGCKECQKITSSNWWAENPEKAKEFSRKRNEALRGKRKPNSEYMKKYYAEHKEEQLLASKERYANDSELRAKVAKRSRRAALKHLGWTPESVEETKKKQNNCCALCNKPFETTPHADHDHETKTPRELLCGTCNQAIGLLQDNPTLCEAAAAYLRKWGK
jgi:hypothetical protein